MISMLSLCKKRMYCMYFMAIANCLEKGGGGEGKSILVNESWYRNTSSFYSQLKLCACMDRKGPPFSSSFTVAGVESIKIFRISWVAARENMYLHTSYVHKHGLPSWRKKMFVCLSKDVSSKGLSLDDSKRSLEGPTKQAEKKERDYKNLQSPRSPSPPVLSRYGGHKRGS